MDARNLSSDLSSYDNQMKSGKMRMDILVNEVGGSFAEYINTISPFLNELTLGRYYQMKDNINSLWEEWNHTDFELNWASVMVYESSYAFRINSKVIERPSFTWMRVALQLHDQFENLREYYIALCKRRITPASPTIFNAGTKKNQMASCFLMTVEDNIESIGNLAFGRSTIISAKSGGLGINLSKLRVSSIGASGSSKGVIPICEIVDKIISYADQGGKRPGAATIFLRCDHYDLIDFIKLKNPTLGAVHQLNTCIWTNWLFWKRIEDDGEWTVFCPREASKLQDINCEEYIREYIRLENDTSIKFKKTYKARWILNQILSIQRVAGMPYLMNGDACNFKSNQRHLGNIGGSNLCLEIVEFTDNKTIASCNLHSLVLGSYVQSGIDRERIRNMSLTEITAFLPSLIDFRTLAKDTQLAVHSLDNMIDLNLYPDEELIGKTNKRTRPLGLGVSGLADLLQGLCIPFDDERASYINKVIFACIYWNAVKMSVKLSKERGRYELFEGSPSSQGQLQFDLWKEETRMLRRLGMGSQFRGDDEDVPIQPWRWGLRDGDYQWEDLKREVIAYGMRNSLLTALMPTAGTSQLRMSCETTEAHQTNYYTRKITAGSYIVFNRYLAEDLNRLGLWKPEVIGYIESNNGSVRGLSSFVGREDIRWMEKVYATMWEIKQSVFIQLAADRARYIDQSQSLNIYHDSSKDNSILAKCYMFANTLGLKTLCYYIRQQGAEAIKVCSRENKDCLSCQ